MKDAKEIWEQIQRAAEPFLEPQTVDIWLKPCVPVRMEGDKLVVEAFSFVADRIREKCLATLEKVMIDQKLGSGIILTAEAKTAEPEKPAAAPPQPKPPIAYNGLNRQYDFASFVVGNSTRIAYASSFAVAEAPGESYNPLFIWGGVGLGKTHLRHAIGNYAQSQNPDVKVLYLSSEKFTNDLITAIKNNSTQSFRPHYRHVDILLIDDIQFLAGKESTQEEFFHTFNDLYNSKKLIVLSSDRPPRELGDIDERIRSRFAWGFVSDIKPPD
ncbi:MAG: chromosomal replication initiator protein DnaA, partial [Pyramidobacter sp.]|nr:chromosomal replication initiator protein DnaA [Pyramidobacter sp.]